MIAIVSPALAIPMLGLGYLISVESHDAHDKAIYAALQGIEIDNRSRALQTPVILKDGGDAGEALGFRSNEARFPYCWLSLTKLGWQGGAMALDCPGGTTPCSDIEAKLRGRNLAPPIRNYISEHCAKT